MPSGGQRQNTLKPKAKEHFRHGIHGKVNTKKRGVTGKLHKKQAGFVLPYRSSSVLFRMFCSKRSLMFVRSLSRADRLKPSLLGNGCGYSLDIQSITQQRYTAASCPIKAQTALSDRQGRRVYQYGRSIYWPWRGGSVEQTPSAFPLTPVPSVSDAHRRLGA